jgi:RNA polymerase sigma factor (sigma-70 family)
MNGNEVSSAEPGTATILREHDELVHHVVSQVLSGKRLSADLIEDLLAAGRVGLLEAKRAYDPDNPAGAVFATFAHPRIKRAVVDAISAHKGVSRSAYRAARRDAARARAESTQPLEIQTKQWIHRTMEDAAAWQNLEPFTDIERGLERDDVRAAIERIPFAREREIVRMVGLEGMAQRAAGERFGIPQGMVSKTVKSGFEMLRELFEIGRALDSEQLPSTLAALADLRQRRVISLLYGDRADLEQASKALRMSTAGCRRLHLAALRSVRAAVVDRRRELDPRT